LVRRIDSARNQAASMWATMSINAVVNTHATTAGRRMDFVDSVIIVIINFELRNAGKRNVAK
jgi:hypothetical protein